MNIKEERKRRGPLEILKLAGCLEEVDDDVAELCIGLVPIEEKLISLADLMKGVQEIKNKLKQNSSQ